MLGVTQLILAYMFLTQIDYYLSIQPKLIGIPGAPGVTDLVVAPLFGNAAVILLLITPLLTMRVISDERRNKTISLLFSAPISITEIVLGKFMAIFAFLLIILFSIALMPLSLLTVGELDYGKFLACLLAMALLMASFNALGLYMSAIASQPTVAAVASFGALLLLWISSHLFEYISIMRHFDNLLRGLINSTDVFYFVLFIAGFLVLSIRRLDNDRLQK